MTSVVAVAFGLLIGFSGGAFSAMQALINGRLSHYTGVTNAVLISITVSFVVILVAALLNRSIRDIYIGQIPPYLFLGGVAGVLFVASITWLSPKVGVTATLLAAVAGQLCAAIILDHFGVLRGVSIPINIPRLIAIALVLAAIPLARVQ